MKVLIFGGNRFVGKRVLTALAAQSHALTVVNRGTLSDGLNSPNITRIHLDRNVEPQMHVHLGNTGAYDLIFDFSCYLPAQAEISLRLFEGRVKRYIFISTQSVYEDEFTANIAESDFNPNTVDLGQIPKKTAEMDYSTGKQFTETVFFQLAKFPVAAIRFPFILGPDDYTQRFQFHVNRVKRGLPIYFPAVESKISLVHAEDAAEALLNLGLRSDFTGPLNLCSTDPISLQSMINLIEEKVGKKAILATQCDTTNSSPYGVETDRFMSTKRLSNLGIHLRPISDWLPDLILP